jgi:hypothetical protein
MPRDTPFAPKVRQSSLLMTLTAPVGGLNARDALANMPPTQAVILENFFPTQGGLVTRGGWSRWYSGIPQPGVVETIIKYNSPTGVEKIFACANGSFYDATLGGTSSPVDVKASGFVNNRWQYVQLSNAIGDFTVAVNGADLPQKYDGTSWTVATLTISVTDQGLYPDWTPNALVAVTQMHRRLWFTEVNTSRVWYLPVDEIQGELALFDLGEIFPLGGYVQTCLSWAIAGGSETGAAMSDQSVFISSKGNVAVFNGFDPTDITNFILVGVYTIGATIGRRCACPYGSDVLILCEDGVLMLTNILSQSKMLMQPPLTDIIQHQISQLVDLFHGEFGWDLFTNARHNQLYLNIPDPTGRYQYLMNTILNAWCVITGYNAYCWENFYEQPYFGAATFVGRAWTDEGIDDPQEVIIPGSEADRATSDGSLRVTDTDDTRTVDQGSAGSSDERATSDGSLRLTSLGDTRATNNQSSLSVADRVTSSGDTRVTDLGDTRVADGAGPAPIPDIVITTGNSIQTRCLQAFNYFGSPVQKMWTLARPVLVSQSQPTLDVYFNTDFEIVESVATLPVTQSTGSSNTWDSALWDEGIWSGGQRTFKSWYGLNNIGFAGAIFLRSSTVSPTTWLATDFQFQRGSTL